MRFKVTQENLGAALASVSRVAASRTALPILSNVLIKAEDNRIVLSSTNLDIAVTHIIGGKVEQEGAITVPARLTNEFISSLPAGNISIELQETTLHITTDQYNSHINGTSAEDFPSLPVISKPKKLVVSGKVLKTALQQTIFAASNDEARQVLTGVNVHTHDKALYFVATDSYRLAEKKVMASQEDIGLLIPANALQDILRIIGEASEDITIQYDDSQVLFQYGDVELISRLVDGKFPDYRQLIPKESEINFTIFKEDLINITKISSLFARESAGSITLNVSEEDQEISIRSVASQVGDNTSRAKAIVTGSGEVALNSRFLLDALSAIDAKEVSVGFSGKTNPCVLRPAGGKETDYLHIVMPLRS